MRITIPPHHPRHQPAFRGLLQSATSAQYHYKEFADFSQIWNEEQIKIWAGNYATKMGPEHQPPEEAWRLLECFAALQAIGRRLKAIDIFS